MSDFQDVKQLVSLKEYAEAKLERVRGGYACPACGSGKGPNKSSAFNITKDNTSWKCFSCGTGGDIFDLAAIVEGLEISDKRGQLKAIASWANIPIELKSLNEVPSGQKQSKSLQGTPKKAERPKPDYNAKQQREREYIKRCQENVNAPECMTYLQARGFTFDEITRLGFGYDPSPRHDWQDETGQKHKTGRVIIPWQGCDYYHIDRAIDNRAKDKKYVKPSSDYVGEQPIYNPGALSQKAFFIVEGILDALAIKVCGYEAIALMGTDNENTLEQISKANPKEERPGIAVVMMDGDEPGKAAQREILAILKENHVIATGKTWPDGYKDAGEWFAADRNGLELFLEGTYSEALEIHQEIKERLLETIVDSFRTKNPSEVATDIFLGKYHEDPLPTGIKGLDDILNGGLRRGLYVLGALSSLGKTTLALQIAEQIAAGGQSVLFVTIEQSAGELVAKSLNRYLYRMTGKVVPTWQILGDNEQWTLKQHEELTAANELYRHEVGQTLRIMEGTKQPTVEDIRKTAEYMASYQGVTPVIFIDYLQLLAPHSDRDTDKQSADKNVMALRQLSRDLKTPVFVISSLNRSSYNEGVGQESFKESGAIEYGADVLLGLQAQNLEETVEGANEKAVKRTVKRFMRKFKAKDSRPCELLVLKNRNGRTNEDGIKLKFEAGASTFLEE